MNLLFIPNYFKQEFYHYDLALLSVTGRKVLGRRDIPLMMA